MFDGSYRPRRNQNLGGKRKPADKKALLEQSRIRREERRLAALRKSSSIQIQRVFRGYRTRCKLVLKLEEEIRVYLLQDTAQQREDRVTPLLNVLLGLQHRVAAEKVRSLLQEYTKFLRPFSGHSVSRAHRVLQRTLQQIIVLTPEEVIRILSYVLGSGDTHAYYWNRVGSLQGFLLFADTYCALPKSNHEIRPFLYQCLHHTAPDTVEGRALLAVLAVDGTMELSSLIQVLQEPRDDNSSILIGRKVRAIISQNVVDVLHAIISHHQKFNVADVVRFLRLVLLEGTGDSSIRVSLLWSLMRVVKGDQLAASTESMVVDDTVEEASESDDDEDEANDGKAHAKSVYLQSNILSQRLTKSDLQTLPKLDRIFSNQIQKMKQSLMRPGAVTPELLSLATALGDATLWLGWGSVLFSDHANDFPRISQAREDYVILVTVLLQSTTGLRARQNASSSLLLNKLSFSSDFLGMLWRYIRSELKEGHAVVEHGQHCSSLCALSLFSDLFTHHLIPIKDEDFLRRYTGDSHGSISVQGILSFLNPLLYDMYWTVPVRADDFKPVLGGTGVPDDFPVANSELEVLRSFRARFMVTGTKLWNSLYERWCRLVRHRPFCDEAAWLFPAMITLSPERSVRATGTSSSDRQVDTDPMDVDDDSSTDEEMEDSEENAESSALAELFSDPKMARILSAIPQVLPFDRRVKLFDSLLRADKNKTQDETAEMHQAMLAMMRGRDEGLQGRERVEIHRERLYDDSMRQLNSLGPKLKRKIQVSFINQHGAQEAGIDGGGVFKEFIDDLLRDAFSVEESTATHQQQLFSVTPLQTLAVNSSLLPSHYLLTHYEFLGRVLGKAVYESILVEPQFCLPFLNQLLGKSNSMEDLKNFDFEYYTNLSKLLSMTSTELENMGLTFELSLGSGNNSRNVELIPRGRNVTVTKQNVIQYVHMLSHQKLNVQTAQQTRAFLKGFRDLIPASWVRLFSAYELQKLISGDDSVQGINVDELKRAMQYAAGYHPSQPVVQWFWEIVEEMTADQQRKFLKFMTSCSRQPLLGFGSLEPAPCLQQIRLPDALFKQSDPHRIIKETPLPTSSTCMNLLKLPNYRSKALMRHKLLAAIESGAGFELT